MDGVRRNPRVDGIKNPDNPADTQCMNSAKAETALQNEVAVDLNVQIGETVQISPVESGVRHYVRLIGYLKGHSVIVTTPRHDGKVMLVRDGQLYNVRMLSGNSVQGYQCKVLRAANVPYPHLHLSYPRQVASVVVRNAERIPTRLTVAVNNESPDWNGMKAIPATMIDVSLTGAMLVSEMPLGKVGDRITVLMKPVVGGSEQLLSMPATIRRILDEETFAQDPAGARYGIQFGEVQDTDRLVLHAFVYEQMHLHGTHP